MDALKKTLLDTLGDIDPEQAALVERAIDFAHTAHKGQTRVSKEPYITHPLEVAIIAAQVYQNIPMIIASLLHDTLEDTSVTEDDISENFGDEVLELVKGVTKLSSFQFHSKEKTQIENYRRLFLAMAADLRVVIIKLSDRLHNMRTIHCLSEERRQRIAKETMDIFAPLAHRLGMGHIKWELEDLAFHILDPDGAKMVDDKVDAGREAREGFIDAIRQTIETYLKDANIPGQVTGRPKHLYSIYKKLIYNKMSYEDIYDLLGVRIIVNTVTECYQALGLIHQYFRPIEGRFKDYISMPKGNMYQSLHTTVMTDRGWPLEVQIRTENMDRVAEYGIAAHWKYKSSVSEYRHDFIWLRQILDASSGSDEDFIDELKIDLFKDEVYVFTPKGDMHVLLKGATPLDMAYKIHTDVGHQYIGAKVNGNIVSLDYELNNGDSVRILTQKTPQPNLAWVDIVKSRHAKQKIKAWFRQHSDQTKDDELVASPVKKSDPLAKLKRPKKPKSNETGISVLGERNLALHLAKCCTPCPGDEIIGFITIGHGVSIHRRNCHNVLKLNSESRQRLLPANWDTDSDHDFMTSLRIEGFEQAQLSKQILSQLINTHVQLIEIRSWPLKNAGIEFRLTIACQTIQQVQNLQDRLRALPDVLSVTRLNPG